jgi:hypothetical protein
MKHLLILLVLTLFACSSNPSEKKVTPKVIDRLSSARMKTLELEQKFVPGESVQYTTTEFDFAEEGTFKFKLPDNSSQLHLHGFIKGYVSKFKMTLW